MSFDSRFMCWCSPEGEAECEAIYDQVMERTKARDDRDFISAVIYGLTLDNIELDFAADQWGGVGAIKYEYHGLGTEPTELDSVFFQCDDFRHGLAAVWLYFNQGESDE